MEGLTQKERVGSLFVDLAVLLAICYLCFDRFYPPLGNEGFWFYTALIAILIGSKVVTPFYVRPADAISYSVPATISLLLINQWGSWDAPT